MLRNFLRETVGAAGNPPPIGFAEDEEVGIEFFGAGVATGSSADGVGLVDDEQGAVFAREFAQTA